MEEDKGIELKKGDWRLSQIWIRLNTFGKDKGTYEGTVEFENGDEEAFKFKIRKDTAGRYITLISDDIVKGADSLANKLLDSLKKQGLVNDDG